MKKKRIYVYSLVAAIIIVGLIATFLYPTSKEDPGYCTTDSDCVPAQCCHATSVVNKQYSPDCEGVACTLDCSPGTLDCGYSIPVCANNRCAIETLGG